MTDNDPMIKLVTYIRQSLNPQNETELVERDHFDLQLFGNLVQDGLFICKYVPDFLPFDDYTCINGIWIIRRNIREIAWLNPGTVPGTGTSFFEWSFSKRTDPVEDTPLYRRLLPPPVETLDHTLVLSCLMQILILQDPNTTHTRYLEFGVRTGVNFNEMCRINSNGFNLGIDLDFSSYISPPSNTNLKNYTLVQMNTKNFDNSHGLDPNDPSGDYHLIFIDADHSSEAVLGDFERCLTFTRRGGYIVLHDTYPCAPDYLSKGGSYDCYKSPGIIKKRYRGTGRVSVLTLPLNPGLTIIQKLT